MKWISVKERLPELKTEVLINIRYGDIIQAYYHGKGWCISRDVRDNAKDCYANDPNLITDFDVTHWMPLPEPPKQD